MGCGVHVHFAYQRLVSIGVWGRRGITKYAFQRSDDKYKSLNQQGAVLGEIDKA